MPKHTLVGTWSIVSYAIINEAGVKIAEPFGPHPQGQLIYTENGFMSGHLMSADRSLSRSDLPHKASPEEKVLAFDSYIGYCGSYEVQEERVIHHVTTSCFPNWVGTDLVRVTQFDGDLLTLTAPPVTSKGRVRTVQIIWRRLETR